MPSHEFATSKPVHLRVAIPAGDIQISVHDSPTVEVDIDTPKDPSFAEKVVVEHTPSGNADRVLVELRRTNGFGLRQLFDGMRSEVFADIRVPRGATLELETASADVRGTGGFAAARFSTASGDVEIDHVSGDVDGRTASGDVSVESVDGKAQVKTASGDVELGRVGRDGSVASASGDVTIGTASSAVTVKTASGDARVTATFADAKLQTASGTVEIERAKAGSLVLNSVSGDISVGVVQGTALRVNATAVTGDLSSDIELSDDAPQRAAGEPQDRLELTARTVSGNVRIRRAAPAPVA